MRVLILNDYAGRSGGAELLGRQLRSEARAAGHEAWLMTSTAGREAADPDPPDRFAFGTTGRARGLLQAANPLAARDVSRAVAELRPDVVAVLMHLTQLSPLVLAGLRSVPCAYYALWYRAACLSGTKLLPDGRSCTVAPGTACLREHCVAAQDWLPLMAGHHALRRWWNVFDHVGAASESVRRELEAVGLGVDAVIPHGVSWAPAGTPAAAPVVTFAGRLIPAKGADVALEAFGRVAGSFPQARLVLVGDGPQLAELRRRVADLDLGGRVKLPGHLAVDELHELLSTSWAHLMPSRWAEPFGLAAAAACMRGVPVVASAGGGLADLLTDGETGVLVAPGDVESTARALDGLLRDPGRRAAIGAAGRRHALEHLTGRQFLDRMVKAWESIL